MSGIVGGGNYGGFSGNTGDSRMGSKYGSIDNKNNNGTSLSSGY
jgi:hypothetical protein